MKEAELWGCGGDRDKRGISLPKKDNGILWTGNFMLLKAISATQESTAERGPPSAAGYRTHGWVISTLQVAFVKEPVCFSHFDWSLEWFNLRSYVYFFKSSIWFLGNEVVIVKSGKRICGSGAALANAAILQNKCYFEMKIQSGGKPITNLVPC